MNSLDLPIPPRESILKFERLIGETNWVESDKQELLGYLHALGGAREVFVDTKIARQKALEALAKASDGAKRGRIDPLFDDGIIDVDAVVEPDENSPSRDAVDEEKTASEKAKDEQKAPRKGHGKRSLLKFVEANLAHDGVSHRIGQGCPGCGSCLSNGHARRTPVVTAHSLLTVSLHVREAVECKSCGYEEVTPLPEPLASSMIGRFAPSAVAMLAFLRYFAGYASHRLELTSGYFGLEIPETTQWGAFEIAADRLLPLKKLLCALAAQADVITMDHTHARVIAEERHRKRLRESGEDSRVAMATSGYLVELAEPVEKFALFHTGPLDAGQHLKTLLEPRVPGTGTLVVACDALASNQNQDHPDVVLALCNVHARRQILDLGEYMPKLGREIVLCYDAVFQTERRAKQLPPDARMQLHQTHSLPAMRKIRDLALEELLSERRGPNGKITDAFSYIIRHFERLVTFCRVPRAPVHTNDVERALKKPILHRKNSLFHQTFAGSGVGDLFTSLFFSAEMAGHNPVAYVTRLLENWRDVAAHPRTYLPWALTRA